MLRSLESHRERMLGFAASLLRPRLVREPLPCVLAAAACTSACTVSLVLGH